MMPYSTLPIFEGWPADIPETEGIKYTGSKLKLLPYILELISQTEAKSVLDGFSGSTRVSQALAKSGYEVVANDIAVWSEVFGKCYLTNEKPRESYTTLIKELNHTKPVDGWFSQHYGGHPNSGCAIQPDGLKKPWQVHNTRKLDGIREKIDHLQLSPIEKAVVLTSLILALDRVDNTLGHYVSYLKDWSPRSYNEMRLEIPAVFPVQRKHRVTRMDAFKAAESNTDLAYYDPPYGSNNEKMPPSRVRYASYYHLWTTICLNDKPELFGKAMRRTDSSDKTAGSVFEEFRKNPVSGRYIAVEAIERLVETTNARWILLSYNSMGRGTKDELNQILGKIGKMIGVRKIDYQKNVMSDMKWTNEWLRDAENKNQEFLFLIDREVQCIKHPFIIKGC